jgi:hypothetical protein
MGYAFLIFILYIVTINILRNLKENIIALSSLLLRNSIIGTPISIDRLEIAQHRFKKQMTRNKASIACANLGYGWRLPTKEELLLLNKKMDEINVFNESKYWSCTEEISNENSYKTAYARAVRLLKEEDNSSSYVPEKKSKNIIAISLNLFFIGGLICFCIWFKSHNRVIGNTTKIGTLEIAQHDFESWMNWDDAKKACASLGEGWRLPTSDELLVLNKNNSEIELEDFSYWSSTEYDGYSAWSKYLMRDFGSQVNIADKENIKIVRAVRTLDIEAENPADEERKNKEKVDYFSLIKKLNAERMPNKVDIYIFNLYHVNNIISIKFGNLEIAQHDFEKQLNWLDAFAACTTLGKGWRLPNRDELLVLYKNKDSIGGFTNSYYWSATEDFNGNLVSGVDNFGKQSIVNKCQAAYVRAVRSLEIESASDALEENNSSYVIGNPIQIGRLEIAQHDFIKQLTWDEGKKACAALGGGWDLPTKRELNFIYDNQDKIGGFNSKVYWSCEESNDNKAWHQNFDFSYTRQSKSIKSELNNVRAVRAF